MRLLIQRPINVADTAKNKNKVVCYFILGDCVDGTAVLILGCIDGCDDGIALKLGFIDGCDCAAVEGKVKVTRERSCVI